MNVAYSRGYQNFYGRDFLVTPDVLIPRPETEQIIDTVLDLAGKSYLPGVKPNPRVLPEKPIILDVGTGSGCIAVTLALELPEAKVYASDISEAALEIAKKNASKFGASISFIISRLLEKVNFTPDVVVANLPYVDKDWDWLDNEALSEEPAIALYAEDHGLALIRQLINQAYKRHIRYLVLEADPCQHDSIIKYAESKYKLLKINGFILSMQLVSR
jgi:release factor glutamine methyltransferase